MISKKTASKIFTRDKEHCALCGNTHRLVVHHRMNRGMGGNKTGEKPSNYLTLCSACNVAIESNHPCAEQARRRGIKVNKFYDTATLSTIPVTDFKGKRWLLNDNWQRIKIED